MANYLHLYDVIKKQLPEGIAPSFNMEVKTSSGTKVNETIVINENICGVFIRPSKNAVRLASGKYYKQFALVTLNLYTGRTEKDVKRGYEWSEQIMNNIDKLINKKLLTSDNAVVCITQTNRLRDVEQLWDENNVCCFVINYEFEYI